MHDIFKMKVLQRCAADMLDNFDKETASLKGQHDACLKQEAESAVAELTLLSGGDPEKKGAMWHQGLELTEFKEWDALELTFKQSLKKCPAAELGRCVAAGEKVQDDLRGMQGFWGKDLAHVTSDDLTKQLAKAYATV